MNEGQMLMIGTIVISILGAFGMGLRTRRASDDALAKAAKMLIEGAYGLKDESSWSVDGKDFDKLRQALEQRGK